MNNISSLINPHKLIDYAIVALCIICIFVTFEIRDFVYFRDYSIIFEGAYRLLLGQIPYQDFGSPVGPGSFLIPALFFEIFQPNWTIFLVSQQFQNACLLLLVYALLSRICIRAPIKRFALLAFSVFYLLFLTHPWYNSTATLFLFACSICALGSSRTSIFAAGIFAGLSLLTKQDFGLLAVIIAAFSIALISLGSDYREILPNFKCLLDKSRLRVLVINLLIFVNTTVAVVAIFILLTDIESFGYWFNYGQEPHAVRPISLLSLRYGALGWFVMIIGLFFNNFRLLFASVFIIGSSITRITSGLSFSHYYFIVFIPIIIDEVLRLKMRFKVYIILIVLVLSSRMIIQPVKEAYLVFESIILRQTEHFFFDYRNNTRQIVGFPAELQAFSQHTKAPQQTIDTILQLKLIAEEKRANGGSKLTMLNLSELTPIYLELDVSPPKGLPLWFHTNVSLFPREIELINGMLSDDKFDIILLQGTHEGLTTTYIRFISTINHNSSYALVQKIEDSPSNATSHCEPNCQGEIYVYVKKPVRSSL